MALCKTKQMPLELINFKETMTIFQTVYNMEKYCQFNLFKYKKLFQTFMKVWLFILYFY